MDATLALAPYEPIIHPIQAHRPMFPEHPRCPWREAGRHLRARELHTGGLTVGGLQHDMRIHIGRRADGLMRNIHAPHSTDATRHRLTRMNHLAPAGVE